MLVSRTNLRRSLAALLIGGLALAGLGMPATAQAQEDKAPQIDLQRFDAVPQLHGFIRTRHASNAHGSVVRFRSSSKHRFRAHSSKRLTKRSRFAYANAANPHATTMTSAKTFTTTRNIKPTNDAPPKVLEDTNLIFCDFARSKFPLSTSSLIATASVLRTSGARSSILRRRGARRRVRTRSNHEND